MSRQIFVLGGALLLSVSMWTWMQWIAVPHQETESVERGAPRGNLSDLYPRWLGARELLLHHRDPYGADITREIQTGYYGRPLDAARPNDPKDQQAFAYPPYVVLMLAPTVKLPFAEARRVFFWLFVVLTAVSVPLWLRTLGWRLSRTELVVWVLLTLSCFPAIQGLRLQQLTVLVTALIAGAMNAVARRHFVLAGMLLALATIKPQLIFLLILWLCIWSVGDWRRRQRVLWSFAITTALLVIAGELLLPGWITEFLTAMKHYYNYTGGGNSMLDGVLSPILGKTVSALLVAMLLLFVWRYRRADERTAAFQWSLCFTLATTLLVIPMFAPYNQLLLLPGAMQALRTSRQIWERNRFSRFFCSITALAVFWPFFSAVALTIALAILSRATVLRAWGLPFYPSFAIPITLYSLLLVSREVLSAEIVPNVRE